MHFYDFFKRNNRKTVHNLLFNFDDVILSTKSIFRSKDYYKYRLGNSINRKENFLLDYYEENGEKFIEIETYRKSD